MVTAALLYFLAIFGLGFVLGPIRVLLLEPVVGERVAVLAELPVMLAAILVVAQWVHRRFSASRASWRPLLVGMVALLLMLAAELAVGIALRGLSPGEALFQRDPVAGTAYYVSLMLFGLMPWLVSLRRAPSPPSAGATSQPGLGRQTASRDD